MDIKIVNVEHMRRIEAAADSAGHTYDAMMQHAGRAVAEYIFGVVPIYANPPHLLFLIGTGNNGGDGLVAARILAESEAEFSVTAYLLKARNDALVESAQAVGVQIIVAADDENYHQLEQAFEATAVLVDALFGTGARLPIEGDAATLLQKVHALIATSDSHPPTMVEPIGDTDTSPTVLKVAVDCPSGVDCDSGDLDPLTIPADVTITFDSAKIGQLMFPAAEAIGTLIVADIGVPDISEKRGIPYRLSNAGWIRALLPPRSKNTHKGTFGKTLIVAGSANYIGAPYLAGAAAYRAGTGLVTIGAPQSIIPTLAAMLPEATWLLLPHELGVLHENGVELLRKELTNYDALLIGCGLGREEPTERFLKSFLKLDKPEKSKNRTMGYAIATDETASTDDEATEIKMPPLVIDADGLNLLTKIENWWELLPPNTILTPHVGEFARLAQLDGENPTQQIQNDRLNMALAYAEKWNCIVILKGAFTIVAEPNGNATFSPFASSALATAGTGDVLAGIIVGLLAQGIKPADAATIGVWIHGYAGNYAQDILGTAASVMASDVLAHLSSAFSALQR